MATGLELPLIAVSGGLGVADAVGQHRSQERQAEASYRAVRQNHALRSVQLKAQADTARRNIGLRTQRVLGQLRVVNAERGIDTSSTSAQDLEQAAVANAFREASDVSTNRANDQLALDINARTQFGNIAAQQQSPFQLGLRGLQTAIQTYALGSSVIDSFSSGAASTATTATTKTTTAQPASNRFFGYGHSSSQSPF